jgi:hypothetical protein
MVGSGVAIGVSVGTAEGCAVDWGVGCAGGSAGWPHEVNDAIDNVPPTNKIHPKRIRITARPFASARLRYFEFRNCLRIFPWPPLPFRIHKFESCNFLARGENIIAQEDLEI